MWFVKCVLSFSFTRVIRNALFNREKVHLHRALDLTVIC